MVIYGFLVHSTINEYVHIFTGRFIWWINEKKIPSYIFGASEFDAVEHGEISIGGRDKSGEKEAHGLVRDNDIPPKSEKKKKKQFWRRAKKKTKITFAAACVSIAADACDGDE